MHDPELFGDPPPDAVDPDARRGRGAGLNMASRYDRESRAREDDGWHRDPENPVPTRVEIDASRTIIARNQSPDVPFDRSINPYRGCEHGCIYCFARTTHAHLGLSPGLDFETRIFAKPNAPALLADALRKPGYRSKPIAAIAMGTNTDPYQPVEKQWRIMRGILEVLWEHRHPLTITTKGALITRDIDLLSRFAREGLVHVSVSLTTLDRAISRAMEPRAAAPGRRIAMIRELSRGGIPTAVGIAPIIPGLTDHELEGLMTAGAEAGATRAGYIGLRLPQEVSPLFRDWLQREYPNKFNRVMNKVRELHGGRDYDPTWHKRGKGQGIHANLMARRFAVIAKRLGLDKPMPTLRTDLFRVPPRTGDQLSLGL